MVAEADKRWLREVVGHVQVPYDKTIDGTILYKTADVLSCGHRKFARLKNRVGAVRDEVLDLEHHYENRVCHTCRSES